MQVKARSLEYPVVNKAQSEGNFVFSTRQEILRFPHTYGLFGTFDDSYQPLSPTVKVGDFPLVEKTHRTAVPLVRMPNDFHVSSRLESHRRVAAVAASIVRVRRADAVSRKGEPIGELRRIGTADRKFAHELRSPVICSCLVR